VLALKKAWLWINHHWKIVILGALSIMLLVVSRKYSKTLSKIMQAQAANYREKLRRLDEIHNVENEAETEAVKRYIEQIKDLDEEQQRTFDALDEAKQQEVQRIIKKNLEDPETIDRLLQEKFGFRKV